jgi:hypothetical protein
MTLSVGFLTCVPHSIPAQDPAEKRHLLRLWLSPAEERELPPVYGELYGGSLQVSWVGWS